MLFRSAITLLGQTALATALFAGSATQAMAAASSQFGDMDCFGTGFVCTAGFYGAGDFTAFDTFHGAMTPDATTPVTDSLALEDEQTWTHNLTLSGSETTASLVFRTYAMSDQRGPYNILVNGIGVGTTLLIDTSNVWTSQQIITSEFNFPASILVSGDNVVTMTKLAGVVDIWALDYATLTAVPAPATLALLGIGLAGLGIARRRKSQ